MYEESKIVGDKAEDLFIRACLGVGWGNPTPSNKTQNMKEHWDFKLANGVKVDVKAIKKINRSDNKPNQDIVYIEFSGISGYGGWIYGKADIIAFERSDDFLLISRKKLLDISKKLISRTFKSQPTLYYSYKRNNRPRERVGLIKMSDILNEKHLKIRKA